jgi:hypothetical protein
MSRGRAWPNQAREMVEAVTGKTHPQPQLEPGPLLAKHVAVILELAAQFPVPRRDPNLAQHDKLVPEKLGTQPVNEPGQRDRMRVKTLPKELDLELFGRTSEVFTKQILEGSGCVLHKRTQASKMPGPCKVLVEGD